MKIYLSGSVCVFCDASYHLTDYRVSVTGSSQGLGRALLDVVLASGLRAVATLRNPDVLSEYTQKYSQDKLLVTQLDVSEPTRISEVFKEVHEHFGRIDVVVNNAGYSIEGEIEATPESEARKLFEVDFSRGRSLRGKPSRDPTGVFARRRYGNIALISSSLSRISCTGSRRFSKGM